MYNGLEVPKALAKNELYKYIKQYKEGNTEVRDIIIKHNLRLVIMRAKRFTNVTNDIDELVSVGTIGLIKSVDTFDITRNIEFATYASRCIDNEILMFLRKNKRNVSVDSLEGALYTDDDGKELKLEDLLYDETKDFVADYENEEMKREILMSLDILDERSKIIIMMRFGFYDDKIYSQQEIASVFGISQSYVSRTIEKNIQKLRINLKNKGIINLNSEKEKIKKYCLSSI